MLALFGGVIYTTEGCPCSLVTTVLDLNLTSLVVQFVLRFSLLFILFQWRQGNMGFLLLETSA